MEDAHLETEKPITQRDGTILPESWTVFFFTSAAPQQEAVRAAMEHPKQNQASVYRLVEHNATLFRPCFSTRKTCGDCGGEGGCLLTGVRKKPALLTRRGSTVGRGLGTGTGTRYPPLPSPRSTPPPTLPILHPTEYSLSRKSELSAACHRIVMSRSIRAPGPIRFPIFFIFFLPEIHDSEIA